jgi:hypothetical protein
MLGFETIIPNTISAGIELNSKFCGSIFLSKYWIILKKRKTFTFTISTCFG